jgi:putative colanic acid biosynthesis acetyltransferase WcaF
MAQATPEKSDEVPFGVSPWSTRQKIMRILWMYAQATIFRASFHNWYGFRRWLLRCFGAQIGNNVSIRPSAHIEIPWHLKIDDDAVVGDGAILYSLGPIHIGSRAVISQYAHLCAGTHDYTSPNFTLLKPPITIGPGAWVATQAFIGPGVTVGERAIVAACAVVVKDVPPNQIVGGNPARFIKERPAVH